MDENTMSLWEKISLIIDPVFAIEIIIAALVIFGPLFIWLRYLRNLKTDAEQIAFSRKSIRILVMVLAAIGAVSVAVLMFFANG